MAANLTTKLGQLVDVLTPDTTNTRIGVANASPTRTLDVTGTGAISTSLAIGGATIGTNALAVTGASAFSGNITASNAGAVQIIAQSTTNSTYPTMYLKANNRSWWTSALDTGTDANYTIGIGATPGTNPLLTIAPTTGNVGIGNTSPSFILSTYDSNGGVQFARSQNTAGTDGGVVYLAALNSSNAVVNYAGIATNKTTNTAGSHSGTLDFYTSTSGTITRMGKFYSGGCLTIGKQGYDASGEGKVTLCPNSGQQGILYVFTGADLSDYSYLGTPKGSSFVWNYNDSVFNYVGRWYNTTGLSGYISVTTTTTSYVTTSDETLKNFDVPQRDFKSIIQNIMVKDGEFLADPGNRLLMVSAQQTASTGYWDAVNCYDDREDENTGTKATHWAADYGRLAPLALWGVKDLYAEIEALKAEIEKLKGTP